MSLKKQFLLILILLVAVFVTDAAASITFGVCYVGGREIERTGKPGDTVWVEQAVVHTFISDTSAGDPVVMVPGMGLSSFIYLSTTDCRKGWAQLFAVAGYPVYVYDIPEYSTSSGFYVNKCNDMVEAIEIDISNSNNPVATLYYPVGGYVSVTISRGKNRTTTIQSPETPPTYSYWSTNPTNRNIWRSWGFGDGTDLPIPDDRYPVAQIVQLEKHMPLRYQDLNSQDVAPQTGDVESESIIPLCEKIGQPVILMIHSAAAAYVEPLLKARPELFKAVINLEQAFIAVDDEKEAVNAFAALLDGKLFLSVYADYIEERGQTNRVILSQAITDSIIQQGGVAGFIDLPQKEILGNTHLMMQVNNNDVISDKIINWFRANVPFEPDVPTEHIII